MKYGFDVEQYDENKSCTTLTLGDGSVGVHEVKYPDQPEDMACVGFSAGWDGDIGRDLVASGEIAENALATEVGCEFIMRFTKPESIDVVVNALLNARYQLTGAQER